MTLDGFRPDDVYYEKKPEKPKRNAKTVSCNMAFTKCRIDIFYPDAYTIRDYQNKRR